MACYKSKRTAKMSQPPRRILTPGASRKRKEMEAFYTIKPPAPPILAKPPVRAPAPAAAAAAEPVASNKLLAGYMAHEFLTKGTLFGQRWDPARADAVALSKRTGKPKAEAESSRSAEQQQSYVEVASLLKSDGVHIPGIVNPTQLARWIQM